MCIRDSSILGLGIELDALVDALEHALRDAQAGDHAILLANDLPAAGHILSLIHISGWMM